MGLKLKTFTYKDIMSWKPCYDPNVYIPEDWEGTAIDILSLDSAHYLDKLWCVLRKEVLDYRTRSLFHRWAIKELDRLDNVWRVRHCSKYGAGNLFGLIQH